MRHARAFPGCTCRRCMHAPRRAMHLSFPCTVGDTKQPLFSLIEYRKPRRAYKRASLGVSLCESRALWTYHTGGPFGHARPSTNAREQVDPRRTSACPEENEFCVCVCFFYWPRLRLVFSKNSNKKLKNRAKSWLNLENGHFRAW